MYDREKRYKTKKGHEVRIYATDGSPPFNLHGAFKLDGEWNISMWKSDTLRSWTGPSLNLVEVPLVTPEDIPWDVLYSWINYVAMNGDQVWWGYEKRPVNVDWGGENEWHSSYKRSSIRGISLPYVHPSNWAETLVKRPGHEDF